MPTLNWIGKEAVVNHHLQVPFHLLEDVRERVAGAGAAAALAAALMLASAPTGAQVWKPERPVEIVVGSTAGGALDRTARLMLRVIQERRLIDQQAVILNKPGGAGAVGLA